MADRDKADAVVYAVSSGAYSDYSVLCCFTTRDLAQAYCAQLNKITVEEQRQIDAVDDAEPHERGDRHAQLPVKLSRIRGSYGSAFVEEFELYDFLPGKERG